MKMKTNISKDVRNLDKISAKTNPDNNLLMELYLSW